MTNIEEGTFEGCSGLSSVNIPSTITQIGNRAFIWCTGLSSVAIPASVTTIGDDTFAGCIGLTSVIMSPSVTHIGARAFQNCKGLIYVALPSSIVYIGDGAFSECSGLKTMVIPPLVKWIYNGTFSGCTSLVSLIIPSSVQYILLYAFSNCPELTDVYCYAAKVPFTDYGIDPFWGSDINYATLHVPEKSIEAYKNNTPWMEFKKIVKLMPMFALTYIINDDVYISYQVEEGASIINEYEPKKVGYTFSGWSEIPETMPGHDVTVTGTFTINKYKLTYIVDGEEYKSYEIEYNSGIDAEEAPTKEGYTFSGWSEIPETMPAKDVTVTGTFTINKYKLIYKVDDEEYKSYDVEYNSAITAESAPTKEGYTFSGWSEITETMPAHDVTVTGTFTINKYKLIYIVDGVEYKSIEVEYKSSITPEADPTKDGYNFSGWSDIPETMPAHDVTVTGSFERRYDVGNVTSLISFILRGNGGSDDLAIYDMNGDGVLNIGDLILIVRKVLNSTKRSAITRADMNYLAPDLTQYSAAQFVLNVPENVREQDISLVEGMKQTHQMMCKQIEPEAYAVVVYSLTNSLFMPENGNIVEVNIEKAHSDDLSIQDVILAKPTGETKQYGYMPVRTSISDVEVENDHRHVYNLKGQKQSRINGMQKGVYIENGKKIVVR